MDCRHFYRSGLRTSLAAIITLALVSLPFAAPAQAVASPNGSIAVNTTADLLGTTTTCSLRAAIRAANLDVRVAGCVAGHAADTIVVPAGTYLLNIAGTDEDQALTGDLDVTSSLTIQGAGAGQTIVDANGLDRVLDVQPNATVTLSGLTLQHGVSASPGAGIRNAGTLTLLDTIVRANSGTVPGPCGGGGCGGDAHAGGISNTGALLMVDSVVTENSAIGGLGEGCGSGFGGGIINNGTLTLKHSVVASNTVEGCGDAVGGGIINNGTLTLVDSTIRDNVLSAFGARGGGIDNTGTLVMTNTRVLANSAGGTTSNWGGGISNEGTLEAHAATVADNVAGGQGCGFDHGGGGIANGGALRLADSTLSGNVVTATTNDCGTGLNVRGGGIVNTGVVVLTNVTISGNTADYAGGGIFDEPPDGTHIGRVPTTVTLNNVTLANNTAQGTEVRAGSGGGVSVSAGTQLISSNTILAVNHATASGSDCEGTLVSSGYNLLSSTAGCSIFGSGIGNVLGVDPLLGPLQDNGGPTLTQALLTHSRAIDAANPASSGSGTTACAATDQRGVPRPQDGNGDGRAVCDIGAYEAAAGFTRPPVTTASPSPMPNAAGWNNATVSVTLTATGIVSGVKSITFSASGAQPILRTTQTGSTATLSITAPGTTTVTYFSTDQLGNTEQAKSVVIKIDETRPTCALSGSGTDATGHTFVRITVQDTRSGLGGVQVSETNNSAVPIPAFAAGVTTPVVITATKLDQTHRSQVALTVIDQAGNLTSCDPILTTVGRDGPGGTRRSETFHHVAQGESQVTILNSTPGLNRLKLVVNGHVFDVLNLTDGEHRELDVSAAMRRGENTIIVTAMGKEAGTATIVIAD